MICWRPCQIQSKILKKASTLCKVRGEIVYITCSIIEDENQSQIKKFLEINKNFKILNIKEKIDEYLDEKLIDNSKYGFTLTPDILRTDGYFLSVLKREC